MVKKNLEDSVLQGYRSELKKMEEELLCMQTKVRGMQGYLTKKIEEQNKRK